MNLWAGNGKILMELGRGVKLEFDHLEWFRLHTDRAKRKRADLGRHEKNKRRGERVLEIQGEALHKDQACRL